MYERERAVNNETLPCSETKMSCDMEIQKSIVSVAIDNRERMEEILSVLQAIDRTIRPEVEKPKERQKNVGCLAEEVAYQRELTIEILDTALKIKTMLGG